MNWLRACIEFFCDVRTPGRKLFVDNDRPRVFRRYHDATGQLKEGFRRKGAKVSRPWLGVPAAEAIRGPTALLIRNPLELYGRQRRSGAHKIELEAFFSNLNFCARLGRANFRAFYFEDFTTSPAAMAELMRFLGFTPPPLAVIEGAWDDLSRRSRERYDVNQHKAGGSLTRADPANPAAHRSVLTAEETAWLARRIDNRLTPKARKLIQRYGLPTRPRRLARLGRVAGGGKPDGKVAAAARETRTP